jgi:hypothetical protein
MTILIHVIKPDEIKEKNKRDFSISGLCIGDVYNTTGSVQILPMY